MFAKCFNTFQQKKNSIKKYEATFCDLKKITANLYLVCLLLTYLLIINSHFFEIKLTEKNYALKPHRQCPPMYTNVVYMS